MAFISAPNNVSLGDRQIDRHSDRQTDLARSEKEKVMLPASGWFEIGDRNKLN